MDFTVRLSEKDYLEGCDLKRRTEEWKYKVWVFLFFSAVIWLLWLAAFIRGRMDSAYHVHFSLSDQQRPLFQFSLYFVAVIAIYKFYMPRKRRQAYLKNTNNKNEIHYQVSAEGVSYKSTSGSNADMPWSVFSYWRESKGVFLISLPSEAFVVHPKSCMTASQQEEYRGILKQVLPMR